MGESSIDGRLAAWQRAHIASAAEYLQAIAARAPDGDPAHALYQRLLDVLEPARRVARRAQGGSALFAGSMWDRRSGRDRRVAERRRMDETLAAGEERRACQRRSGRDRRRGRS